MNTTVNSHRSILRATFGTMAALALLVGFAPNAGATAAAKATPTVNVTLIEYKVKLKPATVSAPAGKVKLVAKNKGSMLHEMVVVRAADAAALPVDAEGSVVEDQIPEANLMGEIPEFKEGKTKSKVFALTPGTYVVFCNITEDQGGTTISHFKQGMHAVLTVK